MTMYFKNREEAGRQLAEILFHPYGRSNTVILAIGAGGLMVARPLSLRLQVSTYMVATKQVDLPGTFHERVGAVNQVGDFVYSSNLTMGQVDEIMGEYHNHIESQKLTAMHEINHMMGAEGFADRDNLRNRNVILVGDGLKTAVDLDPVFAFLKPVKTNRLISAFPIASIPAIDRLHIMTDEIRVLSPKENYLETEHYYEENSVPDDDEINKILTELSHAGVFGS